MTSRVCLILFFFSLTLPLLAQQASPPPSASTRASSSKNSSAPDPGVIANGVYRNPSFGFTYKLPFGWVDRTDDLLQDPAASSKSTVLLGVFERPPDATGNTLNSAVVIAVES